MKLAKCEWIGCRRNATHEVYCQWFVRGTTKLTCRNHPNWEVLQHRPLTPAERKLIPGNIRRARDQIASR